jgi:hypothetical protein
MSRMEEPRDLRQRIDRTLDYTDSLLRLPDLNQDVVGVGVQSDSCTALATMATALPVEDTGAYVGTCDQGGCNRPTEAVLLTDGQWTSSCRRCAALWSTR